MDLLCVPVIAHVSVRPNRHHHDLFLWLSKRQYEINRVLCGIDIQKLRQPFPSS